MKLVVGKYVITTDTQNIGQLLNILNTYNVKAFNYKVRFIDGKLTVNVVKGDVILSIENLSLSEAESLLKESTDVNLKDDRFSIFFHNMPTNHDIINRLESIKLPSCVVHFYRDRVKVRTLDGISFEDSLDMEATEALSLIIDRIKTPLVLGKIKRYEHMYLYSLLKSFGIRDPELIDKIMRQKYEIREERDKNEVVVMVGDFKIKKEGVYFKDKVVKKTDLYKYFTSNS
ncbi:hypothetical protein [Sulfolobus acidocaldarius]|uniref:Conserved protein n=4 Tax=Sulfolobus acidocaldarius TaxID=2285 RepID=Q4J9M4_SULAC|nr:hypothetical protein [Sulfolobus acidocaldarius]AAY80506.1 conserved protein [Sulfolobus acidocaldarius DSM 639]AGE71095.1 hypothetical protein SacN8_05650 [Sulfolobus acidocaldarius N8]AGE73366.1 hypothetical protein SacRon12I_05640 [Sulfolobus acidocaldarius Ron12/I]ALU28629.1 hypothetical protein ATY89_00700 [Sulfolobus acidocaldarius]ALU31344.1 hypothetical protein ATZ20_03740 [Sulfolobus acidocaldarius]